MHPRVLILALTAFLAIGCAVGEGGPCFQNDECSGALVCCGASFGNNADSRGTCEVSCDQPDAGSDATVDASADASSDASSDAGGDAASDAGVDAATDAAGDAATDAAVDAGADAASDAAADA